MTGKSTMRAAGHPKMKWEPNQDRHMHYASMQPAAFTTEGHLWWYKHCASCQAAPAQHISKFEANQLCSASSVQEASLQHPDQSQPQLNACAPMKMTQDRHSQSLACERFVHYSEVLQQHSACCMLLE